MLAGLLLGVWNYEPFILPMKKSKKYNHNRTYRNYFFLRLEVLPRRQQALSKNLARKCTIICVRVPFFFCQPILSVIRQKKNYRISLYR